jgi:hypothetical protein
MEDQKRCEAAIFKSIVLAVKAYKQSIAIRNISFCNLSRAIACTLVHSELLDNSYGGPKLLIRTVVRHCSEKG